MKRKCHSSIRENKVKHHFHFVEKTKERSAYCAPKHSLPGLVQSRSCFLMPKGRQSRWHQRDDTAWHRDGAEVLVTLLLVYGMSHVPTTDQGEILPKSASGSVGQWDTHGTAVGLPSSQESHTLGLKNTLHALL